MFSAVATGDRRVDEAARSFAEYRHAVALIAIDDMRVKAAFVPASALAASAIRQPQRFSWLTNFSLRSGMHGVPLIGKGTAAMLFFRARLHQWRAAMAPGCCRCVPRVGLPEHRASPDRASDYSKDSNKAPLPLV
jgi:hypothetical protein